MHKNLGVAFTDKKIECIWNGFTNRAEKTSS